MKTRTRFAPSLTGYLHLGHVLHMTRVWDEAQARGGEVVCRMEDHDLSRNRPEYEPAILADMQWLGFVPDLGLSADHAPHPSEYRQSDCGSQYEKALNFLVQKDLVYGCECSRRQIQSRQPQASSGEELGYDGACAHKNLPLAGNTVRFRVPPDSVTFRDLALGEQVQVPSQQCGDFSLRDRSGQWTYQFCCVCDDIRHGINLVIRGKDLLASTARQIQLFQALEQAAPTYLHHDLLCDSTGQKLSKRQHAESIAALREKGVSAQDIRDSFRRV